jgi:DNA-binding NarL/FixJ family response regulator
MRGSRLAVQEFSRGTSGDVAEGPAPAPTTKPLRVLLLEDNKSDAELISHELKRSGLTTVIERVGSEEEFLAALQSFAPDVVLSDHSLAEFDSSVALEAVREVRPTTPFILVTGVATAAHSVAAIRAGAEDLILKTHLGRLGAAINNALVVRRPLQKLTQRQVEVLRLVAEGYRTRDIANQLGLSVKTVESHRGEIMKRLRVHDVVSLARYAIRVGLIPLTFSSDRERAGQGAIAT